MGKVTVNGVEYTSEKHGKNSEYLRIKVPNHPLSNKGGLVPLHRFILFERLGRPQISCCSWCDYPLQWKSDLYSAHIYIVNADHIDGNPANNDPANLTPSCCWCNINRSWAENQPEFWANWRRWLKDVPPGMRPNLCSIAYDFGIDPERYIR